MSTARILGYRFLLIFCLVNIGLSLLVGFNYLSAWPHINAPFSLFLFISFLTQLTLFFGIGLSTVALIHTLLPQKRLMLPLAVIIASGILFGLICDSIAYNIFHMHYAAVGLEIFKARALAEVVTLGYTEITGLTLAISCLLAIESALAWVIWRYSKRHALPRATYAATVLLACSITLSYGMNYIARNNPAQISNEHRMWVLNATRVLPYYDELYQFLISSSDETVYFKNHDETLAFPPHTSPNLHYPQHPLSCAALKKPLNIVVIAIDTWRFDALNAKASPTLQAFAHENMQFTQHLSGGNCTKAGLFSLFYGLPATYWNAFLQAKRPPVFIQELLKQHYTIGIFSSAALSFPAFNQTIFSDIKSLQLHTPGENTRERDKHVTERFKAFLTARDKKQPFFSFIFYDAVHNYCEPNASPAFPFAPQQERCNRLTLRAQDDPTPYLNRYLNTVHFVDQQIKQVLAALKQQHLLDDTLIIITADHGEEINDQHSGYWQHASAYTAYQLHVPFILHWPGASAKKYTHATTHYDVMPTLLTDVLHCQNPADDYATGLSLFDAAARPPLIANSYADYAVLSKRQTVRVYPYGDYSMESEKGQPLRGRDVDLLSLREANRLMERFFMPIKP